MRRLPPSAVLATPLLALSCAASDAASDPPPPASHELPTATPVDGAPPLDLPPRHTAYVELPARSIRILPLEPADDAIVGAARLSYRFAPVENERAPLCVVLSGGPGVTSAMLQRTLGVGKDSSGRLEGLCHGLFIDERNTGFSYNLNAASTPIGASRYTLADNNPYTDAGDFVWVLLDLYQRYPDLTELPLVVFGQSYGGVRATVLLDLLLHRDAYANGDRPVVDDGLFTAISDLEGNLGFRFADTARFQVLVQPTLAGTVQDQASGDLFEEEGSVIHGLAAELGVEYSTCEDGGCVPYFNAVNLVETWGRSVYHYEQPAGLLQRKFAQALESTNTREGFAELLAAEPETVQWLNAASRVDAWRLAGPDDEIGESSWASETLGALNPDDRYFMPFNNSAFVAFSSAQAIETDIDWLDPSIGDLFLENCRNVPTFLTRARFDLVNYSPGLLRALASYPTVGAMFLDEDSSTDRPGIVTIRYADGHVVELRSPEYEAGHALVTDQGDQLLADVAVWLSGIPK